VLERGGGLSLSVFLNCGKHNAIEVKNVPAKARAQKIGHDAEGPHSTKGPTLNVSNQCSDQIDGSLPFVH
jgi:hypothetical protein